MLGALKKKVRLSADHQENQKLSAKARGIRIDLLLSSLLCILLALNPFCAAVVLPAERSATTSSALYYDNIEMLQRQLAQGRVNVRTPAHHGIHRTNPCLRSSRPFDPFGH
jgi:hypothetical protein